MWLHGKNRGVFLKRLIRSYYGLKPLEEPSNLHMREVALESLEDGKYIRHLFFPYMEQLYDYILNKKTPLHLYYSSALYGDPSAEDMELKGWQGSELIFDIDADKYPDCGHSITICLKSAVITNEGKCPTGEEPINYSYVPWECIVRAWESVLMLRDILREEFGLTRIEIYFSGNRGFHVRVLDEAVLTLSRDQRRLLVDYVTCSNLDVDRVFPSYRGKTVFRRLELEHGLRRRVLSRAISRGVAREGEVAGLKGVYVVDSDVVNELVRECCLELDKVVTIDTSRLSRFGNSLNMKSGLRVTRLDPGLDLAGMGFRDFSPFKGSVRVRPLVTVSKLNVLDTVVDLKKGERIYLEAPYAIYLVIHGIVDPEGFEGVEVKL